MSIGSDHALTVLEFGAALDMVAGHAGSPAGARRVRALTPMTDAAAIDHALDQVDAIRRLMDEDGGFAPELVPELDAPLARLRVPGTAWTGPELRLAHTLLGASRRSRDVLRQPQRDAHLVASLTSIIDALVHAPQIERDLDRVVNEEGVVRDDASPALRKVRRELRGAEGDLVRMLERLMAKLETHHRVDDASVSLRNGRYVIPVRREGRGAVGGIVHDTSASGATVFVEPPAAVEAGNRIRELEAEELREVHRVLLEVTDTLRPERDALIGALVALTELDALAARARYARSHGGTRPGLALVGDGFAVHAGRHPLLLARDAGSVVPFDLVMEPGERTLLVSGPNTGGKTVLLKAMALLSLLVQSGIPAPVGPESRVPMFDRFFGDIGDEQSIAASLSTFSAHLRNLGEILREATAASLVLIDELGSGTDPIEGAALGGAILEELTRRGTFTIATTHLGALKELAQEVPGVVNASLQFDAVRLAPTYRLIKGIPGRSYGISIARRLALPESVLTRAEQRVPIGERDVAALLEDLEARQESLVERERDVAARAEAMSERAEQVSTREREVKEKERELERSARQEARRHVLDARQEIERLIKQLRDAGRDAGMQQLDAAALEIRRAVEREAAAQAAAIATLDGTQVAERDAASALGDVVVGATVSVSSLGGKAGEVIGVRNGEATVMVGAMKISVPVATLRVVSRRKREPVEKAIPLIGDQPDVVVRTEVDLRGMRVMDVDDAVLQAVDDAVRADLSAIRIIHGKGTGALRERVTMLLKTDRRVKASRMGAWNEGGAGVTIVEIA